MMHPHSPDRRGACFPPFPHSLMALCDQLIPVARQRLPRPTARPPTCSPGSPTPALRTGTPLLPHAPPDHHPEPVFPGGSHRGAGVPKTPREPHAPHTSPAIRKTAGSPRHPVSPCHGAPRPTVTRGFAVTPLGAANPSLSHHGTPNPHYPHIHPRAAAARAPQGEEQQPGWLAAGWALGWGPHTRLQRGLVGAATRCWELLD